MNLNLSRVPKEMIKRDDKLGLIVKEPVIIAIGKEKIIAVGWYDSERRGQFEFHLTMTLKTFGEKYMTGYYEGKVIFLGRVKDWPISETDKTDNGHKIKKSLNPKSYIVNWIIPDGIGIYKGKIMMPSPVTEVILIGHPEYGLIRPENYCNIEEREQTMKNLGWL
ncbi:MAG: hypothetical protein AAB474_01275 [Patescibacteria group bacterium]